MTTKKRDKFARVGTLSIALLLSLCIMGVGYAAWSDAVSIEGTVKMGYIEVELSPGTCSDPIIACSLSAPDTLLVNLTDAGPGIHTCSFTIANKGTLPVKIESIVTSSYPEGVDVSVSGVEIGTQIDQAGVTPDSVDGKVIVTVPADGAATFSLSVAFSFVEWNLYGQ